MTVKSKFPVRGLDLANLLRHAYMQGYEFRKENPASPADEGMTNEYDPTGLPAFTRLTAFIASQTLLAQKQADKVNKSAYYLEKLEGLLSDTFDKVDRLAENPEPQRGERDYHLEVRENLGKAMRLLDDLQGIEKEANDGL